MVQSNKLLLLKTIGSIFPTITFGYLSFGSYMKKVEPATDCYAIDGIYDAIPAEEIPGDYSTWSNVSLRFRALFLFAFVIQVVRLVVIVPAEWIYTLRFRARDPNSFNTAD